jgi:small GTP-binding protein
MASIQKKVCLVGDFAVGKTSLVRRFIEGIFDDKYLSTIGVKVDRKTIQLPHNSQTIDLTMLIWDLVGGEKFDRVISSYYRGAAGAVLVCDLSRPETMKRLTQYAHEFWSVNPRSSLIVVGNKLDLVEQSSSLIEELTTIAAECHAPWFVSSAKTGENVETLFEILGQRVLE